MRLPPVFFQPGNPQFVRETEPFLILVYPLKQMFFTWFPLNFSFMKKMMHSFHLGETAKTALYAFGFLTLVMLLSYLYWFA